MRADKSWIGDQAFGEDAGALVTVTYKSHQDALLFVRSALTDDNGVGLLQGPKSSGKTTILRRLSEQLPRETAVALIDGTRIKPRELLSRMLAQFGYETSLESNEELIKMMSVFAMQQTRTWQPPILIVDNVDRMYPSALGVLNTLAQLEIQERFAMRIIVSGGEALNSLIESRGMASLASRSVGSFVISPLSLREALIYLHARLGACGVNNADTVFPVDVCDRLYQQSGGWPGLMNQFAREAIGRAAQFPLRLSDTEAKKEVEEEPAPELPVLGASQATSPLPPRLIVTRDGETLMECTLTDKKTLLGRSDFADIVIEDDFISKMHAVFLLYADALVLLDLNSANGTTVNSVRVGSTILKDNDIVSLGNHRLKVENAPPISDEIAKLLKSADTVKMKNLIDMRRLKARKRLKAANKSTQRG
ncbi:MAG: FHA domain-containing protein [Gammaproteobacteria bacterium]|nr:FHA domain-containing protein [Gammaproteobacteria bacterium]MDH3375094.1 FHA domain-containing protein [Gammaproteobacteria bacterium]MDH3553114.1 FHA domain-containing protein [Gammaproteobacteria bacterium]